MIDASRGFLKDGNKNRLREQDIHRIVDVFTRQLKQPGYARMVSLTEIASPANAYNLNIPRYIDSSQPEDLHDLDAHLRGGIPDRDLDALQPYWAVFPSLRRALFKSNGRPGSSQASAPAPQLKATILAHTEFTAYTQRVSAVFKSWRTAHEPRLRGLEPGDPPKAIIHPLSEDLLVDFAALPLLDPYAAYQRLMDYWAETMQDDVSLITADGWREAARPRSILENKTRQLRETPDLVIKRHKYKMDLIQPGLIAARYFAAEQAAFEALGAEQETAARSLEDFVEDHAGEGGLLEEVTADKGVPSRASIKARLKTIHTEPDSDEERAALTRCLALIEAKAAAGKAIRDARAALDERILARYASLTQAEIKTLVVEDKWLAGIQAAIEDEVHRLMLALASRVTELEERYAAPLSELERTVDTFGVKVAGHLKKMGLAL